MKKRIIALLLMGLMIAPSAVSCSSGSENAADETDNTAAANPAPDASPADETPETDGNLDANGYLKDDLPELDFGGQQVAVLYWSDVENAEFDVEELTGEIVNDAIYQRNIDVEDRLKVGSVPPDSRSTKPSPS